MRVDGSIGAKIDILSIKYKDEDTPDYYKQICIPKTTTYEWDMDKGMVEALKKAKVRQVFLSDMFDKINKNVLLFNSYIL